MSRVETFRDFFNNPDKPYIIWLRGGLKKFTHFWELFTKPRQESYQTPRGVLVRLFAEIYTNSPFLEGGFGKTILVWKLKNASTDSFLAHFLVLGGFWELFFAFKHQPGLISSNYPQCFDWVSFCLYGVDVAGKIDTPIIIYPCYYSTPPKPSPICSKHP